MFETQAKFKGMHFFYWAVLSIATVSLSATSALAMRQTTTKPFVRDIDFERFVVIDNTQKKIDPRYRTLQKISAEHFVSQEVDAESVARDFLRNSAVKFGMDPSLEDIELFDMKETPGGTHLAFRQTLDGIPVRLANILVTVQDNVVVFCNNNYRPEVYESFPAIDISGEDDAAKTAKAYLNVTGEMLAPETSELRYIVTEEKGTRLAWKINFITSNPYGAWEVWVDAADNEILNAQNRMSAIDGQGEVFRPDPLTSAGVSYGFNGQYMDNNDADAPELTAELETVTLRDITMDINNIYTLEGPYCVVEDIVGHGLSMPVSADGNFSYTRSDDEFEGVMAYYYIDMLNRYADDLGYHAPGLDSFRIDPHGEGNSRAAFYWWPPNNYITIGDGNNQVDLGEDACVMLHEFGHALEFNLTPGSIAYSSNTIEESVIEGTSDYWGTSITAAIDPFGWEMIAEWSWHPSGGLRTVNTNEVYPDDFDSPGYGDAHIWSSALMNLWWLVGNTIADTLVLEMHSFWGNSPDFTTAGLALLHAEDNLYNGLYQEEVATALDEQGVVKYVDAIPYSDVALTTGRTMEWPVTNSTDSDAEYLLHLDQETTLNISTCNPATDFDTILEVFNFDGTTTGLVNDDDSDCPQGLSSSLKNVTLPAGDYFIVVAGYGAANGTFELTVSQSHNLAVYTLDEGDHENNIIKPRFYIENNGLSTVTDFVLEYYFYVAEGKIPQLDDYWTPLCDAYLQNLGGGLYRIVYDFNGVTLGPGDRIPADSGIIVGVHFADWGFWNKTDDFSDPDGAYYTLSDTVALFDSEDNLIYGSTPGTPGPGPSPTSLEAYILDETYSSNTRTQPRLYIENHDTTPLTDFVVKYYFTLEPWNTPVLDPYWTPNCTTYLENLGSNIYAVVMDFSGYTLLPNGRVPESSGIVFGIHDADWKWWYKTNDHSQPSGTTYALTDRIAIFDSGGTLVYGTEP